MAACVCLLDFSPIHRSGSKAVQVFWPFDWVNWTKTNSHPDCARSKNQLVLLSSDSLSTQTLACADTDTHAHTRRAHTRTGIHWPFSSFVRFRWILQACIFVIVDRRHIIATVLRVEDTFVLFVYTTVRRVRDRMRPKPTESAKVSLLSLVSAIGFSDCVLGCVFWTSQAGPKCLTNISVLVCSWLRFKHVLLMNARRFPVWFSFERKIYFVCCINGIADLSQQSGFVQILSRFRRRHLPVARYHRRRRLCGRSRCQLVCY